MGDQLPNIQDNLQNPLDLSINLNSSELPPPQSFPGEGLPFSKEMLAMPSESQQAWDRINGISKQISPYFNNPEIKSSEVPYKEAKKYLDMGYGYVPGIDNDDFYSDTQGIFKTLGKGALRLPALVTTKLGQTVGFLGALANPTNWGDNVVANAADNTFSKFFANTEETIKNDWLRTFNSAEDREKGFFGRMFTDLDFWTDDFVDGAAFMGSAWIPGYALHKFRGGQRIMGALGKVLGKTVNTPGALAEIDAVAAGTNYFTNAQRYARNIDKYSGWAMATAGESLFEASEIKKNVYESLGVDKFGNLAINPSTGNPYTEEEKKEIAGGAAKNGFLMNAALLSITNLFELPYVTKIFGGGKEGAVKGIAGATRLGEEMTLDVGKNAWQKFMKSGYGTVAKAVGAGILREGLVEENVQLAIQRFNETYGAAGLVGDMLDYSTYSGLGSQVLSQTQAALIGKDPEASMNIGLGGLLGGGMSSFADVKAAKRDKLTTEDAIKKFNLSQSDWLKYGDIFKKEEYDAVDDNGNPIKKTKTVFDVNNEPLVDDEKLGAILSNNKAYLNTLQLASDDDVKSPLLRNILRDTAFGNFVRAHIKAGNEDGLIQKLEDLNKASSEDLAKLGFVKNANFDLELSKYKTLASKIINQNNRINDDIIFDNTKEDEGRKNYLLDLGSKQAVYGSLANEEQKRFQDLKNELITSDITSLSDGLVDQLNQLQYRINSQKQVIDILKASGDKGTIVTAYEKVLTNLENTQDRLLKDNELSVRQLTKDASGFYNYEKDGRNDPSLASTLNKKLKVLVELQNHIDNMGSQWGLLADFKSGKSNFLSLFKETVVDPVNQKIEEDNKEISPEVSDEELLDVDLADEDLDIDISDAEIPPINLNAPSSDLMSYLKQTYDNLIESGSLDSSVSFDNWTTNGGANTFVALYNQKNGTSETLPAKKQPPTPPPAAPAPAAPVVKQEEVLEPLSSVKIGPYIINIGDKINGQEVISINNKTVTFPGETLSHADVLSKLTAFGGKNLIRKGEKGKEDSKEFENGEIENVFETSTSSLNSSLQATINDNKSSVIFGGSDRVIEAGAKINSLSDFYIVDVTSSGQTKVVDRKRLKSSPNPNYPLALGTPAINVATNVTLSADVNIKEFKEYNRLNPADEKVRKNSDYFDKDGNIKKDVIEEFPIRIDTVVNGESVFLGYLPTMKWLEATWPDGKHMNVADDIEGNVEKQKAKLKEIRESIFKGHNTNKTFTVNAIVNAKTDGKLRTDTVFRKASEILHPDTQFGIIRGGSIYADNDTRLSPSDVMYDPNKIASGKEGWPVAIINTPTGGKLMTHLSVPKLAPQHQDFIVTAWKAFHNVKNTKDLSGIKEDVAVVKAVYDAYQIPYQPGVVVDFNVLRNYINDYITYTSSKNQYDPLKKEGTSQLNITEKGELIVWGVKEREKSKDLIIAADLKEFEKKSEAVYEKLSDLYYNVKLSSETSNGINSSTKMKFLSSIGGKVKVSSSPLTYNEYMMNILETNLEKGRPSIPNDEDSSYIYFANPVLTFDVVSSNQNEIDQQDKNKKQIIPPGTRVMSEAENKIRENWELSIEAMRRDPMLGYVTTVFEPNGTYMMLSDSKESNLVQQVEDYYMAQLEKVKKPTAPVAPAQAAPVSTDAKASISNGDKIISVQTKPITDEINDTDGELFISNDKNPEGRIYINMDPLKDILVVPNNTLTVIDKRTGKEIVNQELNSEGAVIFEAMQGRLFVVANINGQLLPFYKSSSGTDGKTQGAWYPFFGYTGAWIVKGGIDKATTKMSYSSEIDRVTDLLNENLVFPDKYIARDSNTIKNYKGEVIIDMNQAFKVNRLWKKGFGSQTGTKSNYKVKGLKENTTSESALVALITGLNTTELDSSKTPKELSEWFNLIRKNAELAALESGNKAEDLVREMVSGGRMITQFTREEQQLIYSVSLKRWEEIKNEVEGKPTQPVALSELLNLNIDFGDIAEDIGGVEPPSDSLKSIATTLENFTKTCN